jgi:hypothetical protein
MTETLFEQFIPIIVSTKPPVVRDERLLIDEQGPVKIYYAPFEYTNLHARLVLVGITPGPTQMANANNIARRELISGRPPQEALRAAKEAASFSGEPMRSNLIKQLNHWGVQRWLEIPDAASLFGANSQLVQTTSLLRYPVFVNDKDYRGAPDMTKHPLLKKHLLTHFAAEVAELKDAIFLGLGPAVQSVLDRLVVNGALNQDRIVGGLLHPSGNNTYRVGYVVGERGIPTPHATDPRAYDEGRRIFRDRFLL